MGILENLKITLMKPEIITLIIGTVLGAALTFSFNRWEKSIEFKKEKKKAIMCLKIELRRIEAFSNAMANTDSKLGQIMPDIDFPVFDLTVQPQQFMYYTENLAVKIYELTKSLESLNKRRQKAHTLINDQTNPEFIKSAFIYKKELEGVVSLINDINKLI